MGKREPGSGGGEETGGRGEERSSPATISAASSRAGEIGPGPSAEAAELDDIEWRGRKGRKTKQRGLIFYTSLELAGLP